MMIEQLYGIQSNEWFTGTVKKSKDGKSIRVRAINIMRFGSYIENGHDGIIPGFAFRVSQEKNEDLYYFLSDNLGNSLNFIFIERSEFNPSVDKVEMRYKLNIKRETKEDAIKN